MSKNGVILATNHLADVEITASSAEANHPVTNVQNDQPSEPWISDGAGTHTWTWDWGEAKPADTLCLWPTTLGLSDTVTLELADDAAFTERLVTHEWPGRYPMLGWGEQPWDAGPIGGPDDSHIYQAPFVVERFDMVSRRHGRITFDRAGGTSEVGCAMLGPGVQPNYNFDWRLNLRWVNPSVVERSRGGQHRVLIRPQYRAGTVRWSYSDALGAKMLDDIFYAYAKTGLALFIPYPERRTTLTRREIVLGRIGDADGPARAQEGIYTITMPIEEAL